MVSDDGDAVSSDSTTFALSDSESLTVTVEEGIVVPQSITQKISASDGLPYDSFGRSADIDGNTMVVGSVLEGGNGPGTVYVFESDGTTWSQSIKLIQDNPKRSDRFGQALSVSGGFC